MNTPLTTRAREVIIVFPSVYIDSLTSVLPRETVTYDTWTKYIYKSTSINLKDRSTLADACALADPKEFESSDLVFNDGSNCHYGSYAHTSGSLVINGTSWALSFRPGLEGLDELN